MTSVFVKLVENPGPVTSNKNEDQKLSAASKSVHDGGEHEAFMQYSFDRDSEVFHKRPSQCVE